jgi:predicted NAD/FAD-binding protein
MKTISRPPESLKQASPSIAVIGAGISGLAAAWLLSKTHRVALYEKEPRLGGHAHTVDVNVAGAGVAVDTGFIVYNELNYPNLTALFQTLGVATKRSDMSFAVSLDGGQREYSSNDLGAFIGNGRNLMSPRFWSMTLDLMRFFKTAARDQTLTEMTLGGFLDAQGYGTAFQDDFLLPQAAAIWSSSVDDMRDYPVSAFLRFFDNHGLLRFSGRPAWRTVAGGSRSYVMALEAQLAGALRLGAAAVVRADNGRVAVTDARGDTARYDQVLIATHSDDALWLTAGADHERDRLLAAIPYTRNRAVLHTDISLMPRRRSLWSSWNYVGERNRRRPCAVSYWMNRLQSLDTEQPLIVTLNPGREPAPQSILWEGEYDHPCFTPAGMAAQDRLWSMQGHGGIWFAGAWLGAGFHEDGLQSGLWCAEAMTGVRRPWRVANESGRISAPPRLAVAA